MCTMTSSSAGSRAQPQLTESIYMVIPTDTQKVYEDKTTSTPGSLVRELWRQGAANPETSTQGSFGQRVRSKRVGRRRPKPKYLDPTPYELYKLDSVGVRGEWSIIEGGTKTVYRGSNSGDPTLDATYSQSRFDDSSGSFLDANQMDISRLNALRKLNFKNVDLGTAFAEAGKTAQLVGDLAHLTVDLIAAARRRDARGFMQRLTGDASHALPAAGSVVDGYLAYHYGVKPTLQDIAGGVQAITRLPPEEWRVRARGASQYTDSKSGELLVGSRCAVRYSSSLLQSCRTQISATRRLITRGEDLRWALGLDDPLSTAWELTPFSFVADWVFPVGDWLAGLNASKYFTNWEVSSTQMRRDSVSFLGTRFARTESGVARDFDGGSSRGGWESVRILRTVQNTLPMTTIPVKNPVSVDHMAKGLSLLASTLARGGEVPRFLKY